MKGYCCGGRHSIPGPPFKYIIQGSCEEEEVVVVGSEEEEEVEVDLGRRGFSFLRMLRPKIRMVSPLEGCV